MGIILTLVQFISLLIGLFGISIIAVGAFKGAHIYFNTPKAKDFQKIRLLLAQHLILGLDFLVGKDVIDTILLDTGERFWEDLAGLIVVVMVRVVLTHFAMKELHEIKDKKPTKKSKKAK